MLELKIEQIKIKLDDRDLNITLEDARTLYVILNDIFNVDEHQFVPKPIEPLHVNKNNPFIFYEEHKKWDNGRTEMTCETNKILNCSLSYLIKGNSSETN